ncbi:serine/arginine repetitive matrix protein 2 [Oncorhynchus kisutch]|uniref:serine/arginine repetitive matrix protein 2 n=1 Tax=Oncorhynchus kisutch TaxID=8019 RepID=UPI0012DF5923|nr:serine/arginine repetitive matrix protein 2-like [Oncorhynchus kisutch]
MPLSGDDLICPKFQPNIFDSSRCHDCLRQKHLHSGTSTGTGTAETPQQSLTVEKEPGQATVPLPAPQLSLTVEKEPGQATVPPPAPQAVKRDTSAKTEGEGIRRVENSYGLSVVSSVCDVSGDQLGYEESSLCILSPDCDLYICDGDDDDSTDSCRDQSVYADLSGSISAEDDYLPLRHRSTHLTMTHLDPPPHRTNPKAWMEEDNSRGRIGRHSGLKEERNRESGYFSLGRAGGARSLRDQSPPPVYRHSERGHPLYSNRSPEPKATIPFRNPNLGLASERLNPEILNPDLPLEIPEPPDTFDLTIEVEAQVGPRSPSPTPFKIAESLASTNRRGFNSSYSRRNSPSYQESGKFNSSRQSSSLSRSSSPLPNTFPFKRSECTTSLNRRGLDSEGLSQGWDQTSRGPPQRSYGRGVDIRGLNKNVISMASSVGSISQVNSVAYFKSALRKNETDSSLNGRGRDTQSSAPSRRGYESPRQSRVRKSETSNSLNGRDSRSSSPSRRANDTCSQTLLRKSDGNNLINGHGHESRNSSPSRRSYDATSQSLLCKSETNSSLNGHSPHGVRCGSPIREGYDAERQSLKKSASRNDLNVHAYKSGSSSPSRHGFDTPCQFLLCKSETSGYGNGRGRDSGSSSPSRKGYDAPSQSPLRKNESNSYLNSQSRDSRSSSPSRKAYDPPGQSLLRKSETNSPVRSQSRDRPISSPSRRGYDTPSQSSLRKSESINYLNSQSQDIRSSSPSRKDYDAPGQSLLCKSETNSSVRCQSCGSRSSSPSRRGHDTPGQSLLHKSEKSGALNGQSHDSRNSTPSKRRNDPPGQSLLRKTTSGGDSSLSYQRKDSYGDAWPDSNPSPGTWRGSTHFLHSTSPSREGRENKTSAPSQRASAVTWETTRSNSSKQGLETRSSSPNTKGLTNRNLSPSPQMQRHTSSQSSMESSESGQLSGESTERNREEYAMMADLPKVKPVLQRERLRHVGQTPNRPSGRQELFKPASHSLSKHPSREWLDDSGDLERNHIEWHNGSSGRLSRAHSSTSLQTQG